MKSTVKLIAAATFVAFFVGACAPMRTTVEINPKIRNDAGKIVLMPAYAPNGDEKTIKSYEVQLLRGFNALPGSEAAKAAGLYDKVRPEWEKMMQQLSKGGEGYIADVALQQVLKAVGKATGVDAILVSVISGSAGSYEKNENIYFACGLWDLRDNGYRWIVRNNGAKGIVPVPFDVFLAKSVDDMKKAVIEKNK